MARERILIVAPSWVGDSILSEPLVALLRDPYEDPIVDVLVAPWCAPVYARMRGIRRIVESPFAHGKLDLPGRKRLALDLRKEGYTHAFVLPNSWKSALVPFLARIPKRVGYKGEARWGLLTDARPLDKKAMPRLVDRFAALAVPRSVRAVRSRTRCTFSPSELSTASAAILSLGEPTIQTCSPSRRK